MHYQLAGASTELSWQISCYIVDRAAEKYSISFPWQWILRLLQEKQLKISEAEKQQKTKKRNQIINKTQTTKKQTPRGQDTEIWVLYLFGSGVLYA